MYRFQIIILILSVIFIDTVATQGLFAAKNRLEMHRRRWEYEEREWSAPKVELNVQYRVPVVDTIGFLAVNYDEPEKLNRLLVQVRPISRKVAEMSGGTFQGGTFPAEVEAELGVLRKQMMSDVTAIYGQAVTNRLEAFLKQKYGALSSGLFGPILD